MIAWAQSQANSIVVLDDLLGRRCAQALRLPLIGTLGLVLMAKRRGAIPSARLVVEKLVAHGMYLSERVVGEALALVGE